MKIQIYDPPMCCSTGICGPGVDPALVEFTADLDWLKRQGIEVERYNLSQQTQAFVSNSTVSDALKNDGNECLPLILVDGKIVMKGAYPTRQKLAEFAGIELTSTVSGSRLKFTVEQAALAGTGCCSDPTVTDRTCGDANPEKQPDKKSSCC